MTGPQQSSGPASGTIRALAAGVVLFQPDAKLVRDLLARLRPQVDRIIVFVNWLDDRSLRQDLIADTKVSVIDEGCNRGIGLALNRICERAALEGFADVVLLDQDSRPGQDLIPELRLLMDQIAAQGGRPAAIAPRLISPSSASHKPPRYFFRRSTVPGPDPSTRPVQYLPTSGSLVSLEAFRAIGPFRGDFFIDAIDLEWCFRAWSRGYSCWLAADLAMEHTVGEGTIGALGLRTPQQKDFRLETYVRNTVYGFRLPHIPLYWKLRQAAYLTVQLPVICAAHRCRPTLLRRLGRGLLNGLRGNLGPPEGVPFTQDPLCVE